MTSFSSEIVIYAFLLGFFSPTNQNEWYSYEFSDNTCWIIDWLRLINSITQINKLDQIKFNIVEA